MKEAIKTRIRAFRIFQKTGCLPWRRPEGKKRRKGSGDFYKGAFDGIPFLNKDARRTFNHLLLRPGYMIRDYIRGDHENYLAPLTALIVFYAFFALVSAVLSPIQAEPLEENGISVSIAKDSTETVSAGEVRDLVHLGYTYLNLDRHPEAVHTRLESSLAALEGTLRSQGIPLFLGKFIFLWISMLIALRKFKLQPSAVAAASAYILCQFSFFMIFALMLTLGRKSSIGAALMGVLLVIDYRQWLDISWWKSIKRTLSTGLVYAALFTALIILIAFIAVVIVASRGA